MQPLGKGQMTSRERVRATALGQPVDRVPVMLGLNPHAASRMIAMGYRGPERINDWLAGMFWRGFPDQGQGGDLARFLPILMMGYAYGAYALHLGADIAIPLVGLPEGNKRLRFEQGRLRFEDEFGCTRGVGEVYADVVVPAIRAVEDLKDYRFPDAANQRRYAGLRAFRQKHPDACLLSETFGVQDLPGSQLWTMEGWMMALYDCPAEVKAFQQRMAQWSIELAVNGLRAGGDIVLIYDDYGSTGRTMISMPMWEEFTLPHLTRIVDAVHEEGGLVMLHSCGYQMPFLKHYARIGVDILQTFQPKAGNDLAKAVAEHGDRLAFCTGIDIQLGELMTPEELRADILERYRVGKSKNRFILGTTHQMQYTMPADNIRAILETVREIQLGLHG